MAAIVAGFAVRFVVCCAALHMWRAQEAAPRQAACRAAPDLRCAGPRQLRRSLNTRYLMIHHSCKPAGTRLDARRMASTHGLAAEAALGPRLRRASTAQRAPARLLKLLDVPSTAEYDVSWRRQQARRRRMNDLRARCAGSTSHRKSVLLLVFWSLLNSRRTARGVGSEALRRVTLSSSHSHSLRAPLRQRGCCPRGRTSSFSV